MLDAVAGLRFPAQGQEGFSLEVEDVLLADRRARRHRAARKDAGQVAGYDEVVRGDLVGAEEVDERLPERRLASLAHDPDAAGRLFETRQAAVIVTSPPYATQREYDPASGFQPVKPEDYLSWFCPVADNIASVLAPDGSYLLNIKEHAQDGERHLYVKDLTIAHVRQWGWRFVDEFCWRKTDSTAWAATPPPASSSSDRLPPRAASSNATGGSSTARCRSSSV